MDKPLLVEHKARESCPRSPRRQAARQRSGRHTEPQLAALNAKNDTSLEIRNPLPKKSEESPLCQEIIEEEEESLCQEIIEEEEESDGQFDAEKKPPLSVEEKPPLDNNKSEDTRQEISKNLRQPEEREEETDVLAGWWWRRRASSSAPRTLKRPSLKQRLRAAVSAREPMRPIYAGDEREEGKPRLLWVYDIFEKQLVDKREVLYALALATPVAILTAAAGLHVFDGGWAWVAGASVGIWILAAGGMIVNQYAVFDLERLAARDLSRLGVLDAAVLFCFFTYRAFFPSRLWALLLLLIIAAMTLGLPWMLSCIRGDDVISASRESWRCVGESRQAGDAIERVGKMMDDLS